MKWVPLPTPSSNLEYTPGSSLSSSLSLSGSPAWRGGVLSSNTGKNLLDFSDAFGFVGGGMRSTLSEGVVEH